ncbi:hypothetical protein D3C85_1318650 [compost metagenome]
MVAVACGLFLKQQVIAQVPGGCRVAAAAQLADDTDLHQASGFEQRTDFFIAGQRHPCAFVGLCRDQAIRFQLLERGTHGRSANVEKRSQGRFTQLHSRAQATLADCFVNPLVDAIDCGFQPFFSHSQLLACGTTRLVAQSCQRKSGLRRQNNPGIARPHPKHAYKKQ